MSVLASRIMKVSSSASKLYDEDNLAGEKLRAKICVFPNTGPAIPGTAEY